MLLVTMFRISSSRGITPDELSHVVVGPIGTPIAEYTAPGSVEYAEAAARHELGRLDQQEDITERRL